MAHETPKMKAETRQQLGSKYAARLRRAGKLPVVIYGHKQDPVHISIDRKEATEFLHDGTHLLEIEHDSGTTETCLIKDVQYDYLGDHVLHMDLARVDLTEQVTVVVPIELTGEDRCAALNEAGAILEQTLTELEVECVVTNLPDAIVVDIADLALGEAVTVADLKLPQGVATTASPEASVVSISIVEEVEEEPSAPTSVEPEVIVHGKEEEGEEA